jgi:hypothetical protein
MTGRAAGFCAGYQVPGYMNPVGGRGYWGIGRGGRPRGGGRGRCFGGGRGRMFGAPLPVVMTVEQELATLKNQAALMEEQISATKNRIEELESSEKKENK